MGRVGGIYRCKFIGFSKRDVEMCPFLIVIVRSIKFTLSLGSSTSHVTPGEGIHGILEFLPQTSVGLGIGVGYPNTKYIVNKLLIEYDVFFMFWFEVCFVKAIIKW